MELRVLTVCVGNICRSPMMELLLRQRLPDADVSSAGIRGLVGHPMEVSAAAELTRLGGNAEGFTARRFAPELARDVDLILTATVDLRGQVLEEAPTGLRRTFTLLEFAALARQAPEEISPLEVVAWAAAHRPLAAANELDVVDPIGRDASVHMSAADLIDEATATIAAVLSGDRPRPNDVPSGSPSRR